MLRTSVRRGVRVSCAFVHAIGSFMFVFYHVLSALLVVWRRHAGCMVVAEFDGKFFGCPVFL